VLFWAQCWRTTSNAERGSDERGISRRKSVTLSILRSPLPPSDERVFKEGKVAIDEVRLHKFLERVASYTRISAASIGKEGITVEETLDYLQRRKESKC
jgi:hypothetical protein